MTVVIIEHTMQALLQLADRLVVLDQGRRLAEGAPGPGHARPRRDRGLSRQALARAHAGLDVLSVAGLGVTYGGLHALADVSLEVAEGEFVTIVGPNGAGKTTLLKAISGTVGAGGGPHRLPRAGTSAALRAARARRGSASPTCPRAGACSRRSP